MTASEAMRRLWRSMHITLGWGMVVGLALGAPAAHAQETKGADVKPAEEPKGPNTGRLSFSAGVDWTLRRVNSGDRFEVIGTAGIAFTY